MKIDVIRNKFLWKGNRSNSSIHKLVNWERTCVSKSDGDFGVINLKIFNVSLCKCFGKPQSKGLLPVKFYLSLLFLFQAYIASKWQPLILPSRTTSSSPMNLFGMIFIGSWGSGNNIRCWIDKWHDNLSPISLPQ